MHLFYIPECTIQNRNGHISILTGALCDMEQVNCGFCEIGPFHYVFQLYANSLTKNYFLSVYHLMHNNDLWLSKTLMAQKLHMVT